jgi:hypothetical protein
MFVKRIFVSKSRLAMYILHCEPVILLRVIKYLRGGTDASVPSLPFFHPHITFKRLLQTLILQR